MSTRFFRMSTPPQRQPIGNDFADARSKIVNAIQNTDQIAGALNSAFSGTVALAKLTSLGSNGSLTVENGLITAYTPPS